MISASTALPSLLVLTIILLVSQAVICGFLWDAIQSSRAQARMYASSYTKLEHELHTQLYSQLTDTLTETLDELVAEGVQARWAAHAKYFKYYPAPKHLPEAPTTHVPHTETVLETEPVKPEPVKPEPVKPEPVKPEPVTTKHEAQTTHTPAVGKVIALVRRSGGSWDRGYNALAKSAGVGAGTVKTAIERGALVKDTVSPGVFVYRLQASLAA